jgi:hypothetical protein
MPKPERAPKDETDPEAVRAEILAIETSGQPR